MWPFNRGWPLNGGPLNRGSTVCSPGLEIAAYQWPKAEKIDLPSQKYNGSEIRQKQNGVQ